MENIFKQNLDYTVIYRDDVIKLKVEQRFITMLNQGVYDSLQLNTNNQVSFDFRSYDNYVLSLIYYRVHHPRVPDFRYIYTPSYLETILSYIGSYYDNELGLSVEWDMDFNAMSIEDCVLFSRKLVPYKRFISIVEGWPIKPQSVYNPLVINHNGCTLVCSNPDVKSVSIGALLNVTLQSDDMFVLFRKSVSNQRYIVEGVLNAIQL